MISKNVEMFLENGELTEAQKNMAREMKITEDEMKHKLRRAYDKDKYDVSIIIPVYNGEKFIQECIESAQSQTHESCEVIVVNDGSTDSTHEICKRIDNISYYAKVNGGTGSALNTGIKYARGNWIKWLSADDILLATAVSDIMARNPSHDKIYYTNYYYIDEGGNMTGYFEEPDRNYKSLAELKQEMMGNFFGNGSTSLIHKSIFEKIGYFAEMKHSEDYDFWLRALSNGIRLEHIPIYSLFYRLHPNQLTVKYGGQLNEEIRRKHA